MEARRLEPRRDLEGLARLNLQIAWCPYGMETQAKAACKQRWLEGQVDSLARMQTGDWAATWSAVRKMMDRSKSAFRPLAPMLGDDGKSLASLRAKADEHQRELMKELAENCVEFSEAEHLAKARVDKEAAAVELIGCKPGTSVLPSTAQVGGCCSHSRQAQIRSCLRAGYLQALCALCAKVSGEGAPILWKGGDIAAVPRKPGPLAPINTREVLCSSCPGKMFASVLRAAAVPWLPMSAGTSQTCAIRGGGTEFAIMTRTLFSSWAQLR